MRKTYSKPEILFEDFATSTNIAGNCNGIVGNASKGTCGVITSSGDIIFVSAQTGCDFTPADMGSSDDEWDGFCYHVPTEYNDLFNS